MPTKKKDSVRTNNSELLKIKRYTKEQRVFIIEQYLKNNEGLAPTIRNFHSQFLVWLIDKIVSFEVQKIHEFWAGGIIRSFFFENAAGQAITVDALYRNVNTMIIQFLMPKLQDMVVSTRRCYIQPEKQFNYCMNHFLIVSFPPRSCDLTPLDFFLWRFLKSKVYVNKSTITHALKEKIKCCIHEIQPHLCKTVMKNFNKRVRMCQQSREGHLPDMLFHT
ncbi:transposase [Vespula squamosa]|uniref:Transposase n=1 Tax=Vespula squamosa TaxID=30214 RepID=A0ABD2C2R9_VESSQ